jgi:hypothetical protein
MDNTAIELTWLNFIFKDLHILITPPSILYYDNLSALHMIIKPLFHARSKHIELEYHFMRKQVSLGHIITQHVSFNDQIDDVFTKPLSKAALIYF